VSAIAWNAVRDGNGITVRHQWNAQLGADTATRFDYGRWVELHDTLTAKEAASLSHHIGTWPQRPLVSVLMPVFDPNPVWLDQAIWSVRMQLYPEWELCIADDASTSSEVQCVLRRHADEEPRIRFVRLARNAHICAASNAALALARGEFIALLDHDDVLPTHALGCVAQAIVTHPSAGLIYSDEDKIDESGRRFSPYFKPAFNYDLFLSQNMISHLGVYRRELVQALGGFREGFEGSQDYDLALRCVERLEPSQIVHIARVLYHWRVHPASTAAGMEAKPYAIAAGEGALNEHLHRVGSGAVAQHVGPGYRVVPATPGSPCKVSAIILVRQGWATLQRLLEALEQQSAEPLLECLIVCSPSLPFNEETAVREWASRWAVFDDAADVSEAARLDRAAHAANGNVFLFLSDHLFPLNPGWLTEMLSQAFRPGVAVVGARVWSEDGALAQAGLILAGPDGFGSAHHRMMPGQCGYFGRAALTQNFGALSSSCWLVQRQHLAEAGGFGDSWETLRYAGVDVCLRLQRAGYRNLLTPYADWVQQTEGGWEGWPIQADDEASQRDAERWTRIWGDRQLDDPDYSPNLTMATSDFSLAWPPRLPTLSGWVKAMSPGGAPTGETWMRAGSVRMLP
jgi:GT2 family glycosyltransferase